MKEKFQKKKKLLFVAIAVVIVVTLVFLPVLFNHGKSGTTISKATLKKAVNISKLSTAEFTYEGITEKTNDKGEAIYHIYYEASVNAGMNLKDIDFDIDHNNKTVTPILPEMAISTPVIDESVIEFLPTDANVDMREVIEICKADANKEIENAPIIKETALRNMHTTIEALLMPILNSNGYKIVWQDENSTNHQSNSGADNSNSTDASTKSGNGDGDNNENA